MFKALFGRKTQVPTKTTKKALSPSKHEILRAVQKLQPCNFRQIAQHLNRIEGSVTPRIPSMIRDGYIRVHEVKKAMPYGSRMKHYVITSKGTKYLREV